MGANTEPKLKKSTSAAKMKGDFVKVLRLRDASVNGKPTTNQIRTTVSKVKLRESNPYKIPEKNERD